MNELSKETSPYLLQHAQNPVHWKAWNGATLATAKDSNKLIIISVGYSACHWCHVMEHESFEDEDVAQTMNTNFVSIKIDREERPDIDAVYMKAVQLMTGRGGWPMNVVALPDGRPFWGGTYFRKDEWINSLEQLAELYRSNPSVIIEYAEKLHAGIENISIIPKQPSETDLNPDLLIPLVQKWKSNFDSEFGGMARAPKFMMPNNYKFLMRYAFQNDDKELVEHVDLTLTKMAYGGLFDTVGGGFSRYSVDMKWHVPHFEKMLYDNAQLVSLYSDAYKRTKHELYKQVIEKTLDFVSIELTTTDGAFYCALDADSLNTENHLEEGAFYVWTTGELQELLNDDFDLFSIVFNINDFGHWENGNYVLIQNQPLELIAKENNIEVAELESKKKSWEKMLYQSREKRNKPRLDDKCLTSWNALMLKGYADAYKAIGNKSYLNTALKNADFIINKQWAPEGHLWHSYKNGKSTINGYLEDYALVIDAFITLYEVTFDENWLQHSRRLTDYCLDHFYDETNLFFAFTSNLDDALIARHFETEDNVIPASNSVMADNLQRLAIYFEHSNYDMVMQKMMRQVIPTIDYPSAFSNWLMVFMNFKYNKELAICGGDAMRFNSIINSQYMPQVLLAGAEMTTKLPFLKDRIIAGKTIFYICKDKTCETPSDNFEEVATQLKL